MDRNDPVVDSVTETVESFKPAKSKNKLKGGADIEITINIQMKFSIIIT